MSIPQHNFLIFFLTNKKLFSGIASVLVLIVILALGFLFKTLPIVSVDEFYFLKFQLNYILIFLFHLL